MQERRAGEETQEMNAELRNAPGLERLVKGLGHYFKDNGEPWKPFKAINIRLCYWSPVGGQVEKD